MKNKLFVLCLVALVSCATAGHEADINPVREASLSIERQRLPRLSRHEFNRLAALESVPLYWRGESLEAGSFVILSDSAGKYIADGELTEEFDHLYLQLVDRRRREAVARELDAGWPIVILTDLEDASEADRQLARHVERAAALIEQLYAKQVGTARIGRSPKDPESTELLRRNQGYWCLGPQTRNDPFCNALVSFPERKSDAYPPNMEQNAAMCESLRRAPNAAQLLHPFSVVRRGSGALTAVPYNEAYGEEMKQIAAELRAAADVLPAEEAALQGYLRAAANSFETNEWDAADEAWTAMDSNNSRWYLRIAPDEVYFDPCNAKAGFHVSFARINTTLLKWKDKLTPLRDEMEQSLAAHIGAPYEARKVSFALPDFIDIVLNAGDSRNAFGATVGQALPNWGPVAKRGDGRTVVMTNLYANPDSTRVAKAKAALLLHPDNVARLPRGGIAEYLEILLHEASHNFGPHSDYRIDGKPPREVFGGLTASIMEELKAQTGALWLTYMLRERGLIDDEAATASLTGAVMWCFGQMSRGLFDTNGKRSVYPTIAAIQVDHFMQSGALSFDQDLQPEGSAEPGRFVIDYEKLPLAVDTLMATAGRIKATGDRGAANDLIEGHTDEDSRQRMHLSLIQERLLRFPKESFRYLIRY